MSRQRLIDGSSLRSQPEVFRKNSNVSSNKIFLIVSASCDRTKEKMYDSVSGNMCFRRLNATHQIGCSCKQTICPPTQFNSLFHCSDREDNWLHWSSSAHSKRGRHQLSSSRTASAALCSHRHTEALQSREHSQTTRLALCVGHRSRQRHARLRQVQLGIIMPQSVFQSLEASLRCVEAGNALESIRLRTYAGEL